MSKYFYKTYQGETALLNKEDITEQQIINNKVKGSGAVLLYDICIDNIIRKGWKDHAGYPLKKKYYDNGKLVCSFSMSFLQKNLGFGKDKIIGWIKILVKAGWLSLGKTRDGQRVFILGEWSGKDASYRETLHRHKLLDIEVVEHEDTQEEFDKKMEEYRNSPDYIDGDYELTDL